MENSWARLVEAAGLPPEADERKVVSLLVAHIGELVGSTPQQTISNWRTRGVSLAGALAAQRIYHCDANWLLTGKGSKTFAWPFDAELLDRLVALDARDRLIVQGRLEEAIASRESSRASTTGDLATHPLRDQSVRSTTAGSAPNTSTLLEARRLEEERAAGSKKSRGVSKPRRGSGSKGSS